MNWEDRNYKLEACLDFLTTVPPKPEELRTVELRPAVSTYNTNVDRIKATFLFPIFAAFFSARLQRAVDESWFVVTGSIYESPLSADDRERVSNKVKELWLSQAGEFSGNPDASVSMLNEGARRIQSILTREMDDPVAHGIEQMFYSQIVGIWTAFETLAADLWEAALNTHPRVLADLAGTTKKRLTGHSDLAGAAEPSPRDGLDLEKTVKLSWLQRCGYDISHKMGTIHRDRFAFDRLSGIRQAYAAAFSERSSKIDAALGNESLDVVNQLRNIIVHRAGVADAGYAKRANGLQAAPKLAAGEQLMFDGESFCKLTIPMLVAVQDFIAAIDAWITSE